MYCQAASYRRNFEVFSVNFRNQRIDHDKISHEKSLALHTHPVKFSWISVYSNTVCCGGKLIRVRSLLKKTQDQLSPHQFENTGSNLFFYVECSYVVNIKPNNSRICWYKKFYNPKHFSPSYVSVSEGGVFQSFPRQRFLTLTFTSVGNWQIHSDLIEIYNNPCADVNTSMYPKLLKSWNITSENNVWW